MSTQPKFAEDYEVTRTGLTIDGEPFPWFVAIEGPKVEAIDEHHHWLWVPVVVRKPAPGFWDGRGEALLEAQDAASGSNRRSVDLGDAGDMEGAQNRISVKVNERPDFVMPDPFADDLGAGREGGA